jgi:hypothetical protein
VCDARYVPGRAQQLNRRSVLIYISIRYSFNFKSFFLACPAGRQWNFEWLLRKIVGVGQSSETEIVGKASGTGQFTIEG